MTDILNGGEVSDTALGPLHGTRYTYTYTTKEEMLRTLSFSGGAVWSNDLDEITDREYFYVEMIEFATGTINQYLEKFYNPVDMKENPWVRNRATLIACYHFTKRRGDPGLYGGDYERVIEELQQASEGIIQVPGLIYSSGMLAVMQNVTVDQRYLRSKSRVQTSISTDTGGREPLSYVLPYEWL